MIRLFLCILIAGISLYAHISKQNELTELRLILPSLAKEVRSLQEENTRLKYDIDHFESPIHLMELMKMPPFSSLKFAYNQDVIVLPTPQPIPGKDFVDLLEEKNP